MMQYKFVIVEHTLQYVYLMAIKTLDFSQDFLGEAKLPKMPSREISLE